MLKALVAFLALPGVVAFAAPFALVGGRLPDPQRAVYAGALFFMGGLPLLLWCVGEFYIAGRGTLAPWAPPQYLVVSGPYRFSRNPMYIGVTLILAGWAVLYWSLALMIYLVAVGIAFQLRVLTGEEPGLARSFGPAWESYRVRTKRWLR
ncbi:MAG TPA: isoprenylcysteine carboxylmethyltransferase family protein [Steroidobacteraceae bacterium]|nr:isoprenylcysteine carboxylmethyltransferase family protein [Steroidobacteraceae bacterium]